MEEQPITLTFEFTKSEARRAIWQLLGTGKAKRAIFGWVLAILLGIILYVVIHKGNAVVQSSTPPSPWVVPGAAPPSSDLFGDVIPFLPWLFVFSFLWFFLYKVFRGKAVIQIAGKQRIYVFRPEGVTIGMLYTHTESQWAVFLKFVETRQFFLLKTAPTAGHVIPKRVFRDAGEMDRFRIMLRDHIGIPTPRQAFPVTLTSPPSPTPPGAQG
jgi:hypothetical protein